MLPHFFDRRERTTSKVRVISDDSFIMRGNLSQLHRAEVWR